MATGRLRDLAAPLRTPAETPDVRQCTSSATAHPMRYPQFRARGLCVSSGMVETGCKQIGARLKHAGMRWTVAGTNAIPALRRRVLSGHFEDFCERRPAKAAPRHPTMMTCTLGCSMHHGLQSCGSL